MITTIRGLATLIIITTAVAVIHFMNYWNNLTRDMANLNLPSDNPGNPPSDFQIGKLFYIGLPVAICFLLMACIILARDYKVAFSVLLVITFALALYVKEATEENRIDFFGNESYSFNNIMDINVFLIVIMALLFVISIGLNHAKRKRASAIPVNTAAKGIIRSDETKECPQCAETIKIKAKVCRFCNFKFEEASNQ